MGRDQGNQGGRSGGGSQGGGNRGGSQGSSNRGFAAMDDDEQRKIAQKGGEASARQQKRDEQGQFAGTGNSGGGGNRGGGSGGGNRGGDNRGGSNR